MALVSSLSNSQSDPLTSERFYDEVVLDLAQLPILVDATVVSTGHNVHGDPDESDPLPEVVTRPLQWFYADAILNEATSGELAQWEYNWRNMHGTPYVVYRADVGARRFRMVPLPDHDSKPFVFLGGQPLGVDYSENAVAIIHTTAPTDLPEYLDLPVAYFILAREFARESDHQDMGYSQACAQLASAFLECVR